MQRGPRERGKEAKAVHAGSLHYPRRRPVALDLDGIFYELPRLLDVLRLDLVVDFVHTRRPGGTRLTPGEQRNGAHETVHSQHKRVHVLFPVLRGDPAYDRVRQPVHQ